MAAGFFALLLLPLTSSALSVSFIVVGICCAYQILAIYKASTYVPQQIAGLTTAVANMIIMTFGYAFHSVIGSIVNLFGGAGNSEALVYGVTVVPIALCLGVAGFILMLVREKKAAVA